MNKTVNINLAGTFFHIDENAFAKLQRYLDAIKRSLSDPNGSDEIIRDIEARIAELFSEKLEASTQVVTLKELDEVIGVMGQPEDYMVDEEIFDDEPPKAKSKARSRSSYKQLFRDEDSKIISGVSAGLGHYLGIDAIWVRLLWILLTLFSSGFFIIIYILFWILVPAAESTSDKLKMTGEPINISNIEKKFKEGYENVSDSVKNADLDKYGRKVKSGASSFFETLGNVLLTLLKVFVKFLGILVIIVALSTLVGLIVGLFTAGTAGTWGHGQFVDWYYLVDTTHLPIWLLSLLLLFAVGIPFFVLFILGLKMLIPNLKSIGTPAKIALFVVWLAAVITLGVFAIRQATEVAYTGEEVSEQSLAVRAGDTLRLRMESNENYEYDARRRGGLDIEYNEAGEKIIYSTDVRLIVRSTTDSLGRVVVTKSAEGADYATAKQRARDIDYDYQFANGTLGLNAYLTTDYENKYRDQEVKVIVYLPIGTVLYADDNTYSFHRNDYYYRDILDIGDEEQYLMIEDGATRCLDCPVEEDSVEAEIREVREVESGIYYKDSDGDWVKLDSDGLKAVDEDGDRVIIDKDGVEIQATDQEDTLKIKIDN